MSLCVAALRARIYMRMHPRKDFEREHLMLARKAGLDSNANDPIIFLAVMNAWNMFRYLTTVLLLAVAFSEKCQIQHDGTVALDGSTEDDMGALSVTVDWDIVLTAISTIVIWMQQIQLLILSTQMEAFTYGVSKMVSEFFRNIALVLLCIFAFSGALLVFRSPGFEEGLLPSVLKVVRLLLGLGVGEDDGTDSWGLAMLIAVVVIVNISKLPFLHSW